MFVYQGQATEMSKMIPEQGKAVMAKWKTWMGRVGGAPSDIGAPLGPHPVSVLDNGSAVTATPLSGTIVEADSMQAAKKLTAMHPFLSDNEGKFAVDIYELVPNPV